MEAAARLQGAENKSRVRQFQISIKMATLVGIVSFIILKIFSRDLLFFSGASNETILFAQDYFNIRIFGQPLVLLFICSLSVLRGLGKIKNSLVPIVGSVFVNIILSYVLIFSFNLGITGAAYATVFSHFFGVVLTIGLIYKEFGPLTFRSIKENNSTSEILSMSSKSINLFFRSLLLTGMFFISTKIVASFGVVEISAFQIALQCWLFSSFFIDGVAMVGNIETAKISKQKDVERFNELTKNLIYFGLFIGGGFTFVYFVFSDLIWSLFTDDPNVKDILSILWPYIWAGQMINASAFIMDGIYFGLGGYRELRKMMTLNFLFVFFPVVFFAYQEKSVLLVIFALLGVSIFRFLYLWIRKNQSFNYYT